MSDDVKLDMIDLNLSILDNRNRSMRKALNEIREYASEIHAGRRSFDMIVEIVDTLLGEKASNETP